MTNPKENPELAFLSALSVEGGVVAKEALESLDAAGGGEEWFIVPCASEVVTAARQVVAQGGMPDAATMRQAAVASGKSRSTVAAILNLWSRSSFCPTAATARANLPQYLEALRAAHEERRRQEAAHAVEQAAHEGDLERAGRLATFATAATAAPDDNDDDAAKPFPRELLACPQFVGDLAAFIGETANHRNAVCDFFGALALLSHLAGRRWRLAAPDTSAAEYFVMLADTGTGKDNARKVAQGLLYRADGRLPLDSFGSGEGIQDELHDPASGGAVHLMTDEFDTLLNAMADNRPNPLASAERLLLSWYTSATSVVRYRALSKHGRKRGKKQGGGDDAEDVMETIERPAVTLYATCTPQRFYRVCAAHEDLLTDGFLGRCLIVEGDGPGPSQTPPRAVADLEPWFVDTARFLLNRPADGPEPVRHDVNAHALQEQVREYCDKMKFDAHHAGDPIRYPLWTRAMEHINRLSLLAAVSRNPRQPVVAVSDVNWAASVIETTIERTSRRLEAAQADRGMTPLRRQEMNDRDKVLRLLRRAKGRAVAHSDLLKSSHLSTKALSAAIETLIQTKQVYAEAGQPGKTPTRYWAP